MANGRKEPLLESIRTLLVAGTSAGLDDADLLERYLVGREEVADAAFEALVGRHGPMVLGVCRDTLRDAHDAQDAFQATFLVLATKASSIRRRESLASWLFGVARKVATRAKSDVARRRAREREAAVPHATALEPARELEDLAKLHEEIDRLPGSYREPVILCYLEGMTYESAARQLRCPLGTLSVRLKRARERLRSRLARRGVTAPIGFLVAGPGPIATRAAMPIALADSAVLVAKRAAAGKATVAGAVPASVVSLAGRTMTMMRYKAIGVISTGLGFVVLAATASVAVRGMDGGPAGVGRAAAPGPEEPRKWAKTLTDGTTVELLGVSPHPSEPDTWRGPDGKAALDPPYAKSGVNAGGGEGQRAWEFAARITNGPNQGESCRWEVVPPGSSSASATPRDADGARLPGLAMVAVSLPGRRKSCTIRLGLPSGGWTTEAIAGKEGGGPGGGELEAVFGKARKVGGRTAVTVSYAKSEGDLRLMVADTDGIEHAPSSSGGSSSNDLAKLEAQFDVPPAKVKEFRLQSRPIEWVVFDGVALDPRDK